MILLYDPSQIRVIPYTLDDFEAIFLCGPAESDNPKFVQYEEHTSTPALKASWIALGPSTSECGPLP